MISFFMVLISRFKRKLK